jgi:hypothetical protein
MCAGFVHCARCWNCSADAKFPASVGHQPGIEPAAADHVAAKGARGDQRLAEHEPHRLRFFPGLDRAAAGENGGNDEKAKGL